MKDLYNLKRCTEDWVLESPECFRLSYGATNFRFWAKKNNLSCVLLLMVCVDISFVSRQAKTETREQVVQTKSCNARPEQNSCCTLCPDYPTACDSREIIGLTITPSLSHTLKDREAQTETAPLPLSLLYLLWTLNTVGTFRIFLQPSTTKRGNFQQPHLEQWAQQPMGRAEEMCVVQRNLTKRVFKIKRAFLWNDRF